MHVFGSEQIGHPQPQADGVMHDEVFHCCPGVGIRNDLTVEIEGDEIGDTEFDIGLRQGAFLGFESAGEGGGERGENFRVRRMEDSAGIG